MLQTSHDILNLVLAVSIAAFTCFLCWLLFVVTSTIKRTLSILDEISGLVESIRDKVERAEKLFTAVEEKLKSVSSVLPLVITGINKIIDFIKTKNEKKRSRKTSRSED
ncbi:MAG: hypothetical protein WC495_00830 [Patescibacteria group bacterium]